MLYPNANITYEVYLEGQRLIGTAQVDLPQLQAITAEFKGAGIAGTIDQPIMGHFQGMSATLQFKTVTSTSAELMQQKYHHLELWSAVQFTDPGTGELSVKQHKIILKAMPKNLQPGKLAVGETQDRSLELEVVYYKEELEGSQLLELDKFNFVYDVGNGNILESVAKAIGLK